MSNPQAQATFAAASSNHKLGSSIPEPDQQNLIFDDRAGQPRWERTLEDHPRHQHYRTDDPQREELSRRWREKIPKWIRKPEVFWQRYRERKRISMRDLSKAPTHARWAGEGDVRQTDVRADGTVLMPVEIYRGWCDVAVAGEGGGEKGKGKKGGREKKLGRGHGEKKREDASPFKPARLEASSVDRRFWLANGRMW